MQAKLTLRLEERLIRRAKAHARRTGKSVSQIVADYFAFLGKRSTNGDSKLTPTVRSLRGLLSGSDVGVEDYHEYLEEKHL
jgi:hypothetical protein